MNEASENILACPFCGQPGKIWETTHKQYYVDCDNENCAVMPTLQRAKKSRLEAILAWNIRKNTHTIANTDENSLANNVFG